MYEGLVIGWNKKVCGSHQNGGEPVRVVVFKKDGKVDVFALCSVCYEGVRGDGEHQD